MPKSKKLKNSHKHEDEQLQFLSSAIQLEEGQGRKIINVLLVAIFALVGTFFGWSHATVLKEVARCPGEIVPSGLQKSVQHLEGGIIDRIFVQDGDIVQKGQVLVRLTDSGLKDELDRAEVRHKFLSMYTERLSAFVEGREMDFSGFDQATKGDVENQAAFYRNMVEAKEGEEKVIREQIKTKKKLMLGYNIDLQNARKEYAAAKKIHDMNVRSQSRGAISEMAVIKSKQELNAVEGRILNVKNTIKVTATEVTEFEYRLTSLASKYKDQATERLDNALSQRAENKEIIDKLNEQLARLDITSPVAGMVKGLEVNTEGGVIAPGQKLMEIVPTQQELEVLVRIAPEDRGHVKAGQNVKVKVSTYDFSTFGYLNGEVEKISATTFQENGQKQYYKGIVKISHALSEDKISGATLLPGMTVMADIITGEKTVFQYLAKPIRVAMDAGFTER